MEVQVQIDLTRFNTALKKCIEISGRGYSEVVNGHAYRVAMAASALTVRVAASKIESTLGRRVSVLKKSKKGTFYTRRPWALQPAQDYSAPLAPVLINWKRGLRNQPGLYGKAMRDFVRRFIGARKSSVAYAASGWIPAIKTLAAMVGKSRPFDGDTRQIGQIKGGAEPCRIVAGDIYECRFWNQAYSRHDKTGAFERYGNAGLQAGIDQEAGQMEKHVLEKLRDAVEPLNRPQ